MEGKVVIMSALLVSFLVLGQIQVEAQRSCCPTTTARNIYNMCRATGGSQQMCASTSGCRHLNSCPDGWRHDILENTDEVVFTSCCPNATARSFFDICRASPQLCASRSGCKIISVDEKCPTGYPHDILKNTVNEYCKSGCVSSVCGAITTLQNSDASEVVKGAVEKCSNACSGFCTNKGSITAVETA